MLCFQESALYVSISGKHGRLGSLKAINVLCFQDPLFLVTGFSFYCVLFIQNLCLLHTKYAFDLNCKHVFDDIQIESQLLFLVWSLVITKK